MCIRCFGKDVLDQLIPVAAVQPLAHVGLPQPPPWRREQEDDEDQGPVEPGEMRVHGFVSKPEIQKLNRNSIYVFVNGRLIRDRLIQHALTEAYRNILPPTVYPVVLMFLELPSGEVDVNVHPSKTEVRFRQQSVMHDFVRDSVRAALMKARPVPQFMTEINAHPTASPSLTPGLDRAPSRRILRDGAPFLLPSKHKHLPCKRRCLFPSMSAFTLASMELQSTATPRCLWFAPHKRFPR